MVAIWLWLILCNHESFKRYTFCNFSLFVHQNLQVTINFEIFWPLWHKKNQVFGNFNGGFILNEGKIWTYFRYFYCNCRNFHCCKRPNIKISPPRDTRNSGPRTKIQNLIEQYCLALQELSKMVWIWPNTNNDHGAALLQEKGLGAG